jgi:hypothetical protein
MSCAGHDGDLGLGHLDAGIAHARQVDDVGRGGKALLHGRDQRHAAGHDLAFLLRLQQLAASAIFAGR